MRNTLEFFVDPSPLFRGCLFGFRCSFSNNSLQSETDQFFNKKNGDFAKIEKKCSKCLEI